MTIRQFLITACLIALPAAYGFSAEDKEPAPWFKDVSAEAGLSGVSVQNAVWADLDGDGYADCITWGGGPAMNVFLNTEKDGKRIFKDFTRESGINRHPDISTAARVANFVLAGDVDNDGDTDLFSGLYCEFEKPKTEKGGEKPLKDAAGKVIYETADNGLRSEILLNDGAGRFHVRKDNRAAFPPETTGSGAFFDYDNDGLLDLYTGSWYKEYGLSYISYPGRLFRGLGGGMFDEATEEAQLLTLPTEGRPDSSRPAYGISHCDWDNDGLQDILVSVYGRQANRLWKNNGDGTFTDLAPAANFDGDGIRHGRYPAGSKRETEKEWRSHGNTFAAACADYDNDGDMDVFLGEITHGWAGEASDRSSLLENLGPKKGFAFRRHADLLDRVRVDTTNWNQGDMRVTWADFDNDGLQDLLLASGDYPDGQYLRLFRQKKPLVFEDITEKAGFDWESSGGVSIADYDNDGRLDILAGKSWMRLPAERRRGPVPSPALFRNRLSNGNHWLSVKLEGSGEAGANKGAIGARVKLKAGGVTQLREVSSSHGPSGLSDEQVLHFGLGKAKSADSIEVIWTSGGVTFEDIPADRFVKIVEGAMTPELSRKPFARKKE
ncbi:MAG: hypothetical protein COT18_00815 [Elusimicrobia bacterium CG08_land_8_20_14_0_20_59_10]|nr:MAG: hypothetical protein COT18_00815 [Elusimicrobia bacterium CG08_land_8_20_14_0_20_59_10]